MVYHLGVLDYVLTFYHHFPSGHDKISCYVSGIKVEPSKTPGALEVLRQIYTGNPGPPLN